MAGTLLSVLIPTRDFVPAELVEQIYRQAEDLGEPYEILILDDASTKPEIQQGLARLEQKGWCRILTQQVNQGRAKARNILYKASSGRILLFIDSDARVIDSQFLRRHLDDISRAEVVCGGLTNPPPPAPDGCELRYKYETAAQRKGHRTAAWRNKNPYKSMASFQLLMRREVMQRVPFQETIAGYGYEDVVFGLQLQELGISVLHTDNNLEHTGINSNTAFLSNTEEAMRTLATLPEQWQQQIPLACTARKLEKWHIAPLLRGIFLLIKPLVRRNLLGHHPSIHLYQTYKLGRLLEERKEAKKRLL